MPHAAIHGVGGKEEKGAGGAACDRPWGAGEGAKGGGTGGGGEHAERTEERKKRGRGRHLKQAHQKEAHAHFKERIKSNCSCPSIGDRHPGSSTAGCGGGGE